MQVKDVRLLGLPLQFVVVALVSLSLTVFLGAWVADDRIEARKGIVSEQNTVTVAGEEKEVWESLFLFSCPLH